jgi:hypothetical protein
MRLDRMCPLPARYPNRLHWIQLSNLYRPHCQIECVQKIIYLQQSKNQT